MTTHHPLQRAGLLPAGSLRHLLHATLLAACAASASAQTLPAACSDPATPISSVQGSGATTPMDGQTVTVQGVVVGDYEGASPGQRGFFIQSLVPDNDPATSEGIFVFNSANTNVVAVGQVVRVTGVAGENQGQTQITINTTNTPGALVQCGTGSVQPTDVTLPFPDAAYPERYEGMLVRLPQRLTVTEHFQLGRFGQVVLSVNGRQMQPTNVVAPGAPAQALQAANLLGRIILDDASQAQNPDPIAFGRGGLPLSAGNTLRGGDTLTGVVGVMGYTWGGNAASPNNWRVRPLGALGGVAPQFEASNPRPSTPPATGGLRVAGFNVLNFFNNVAGCSGGVSGAAIDCRGAGSDAGSLANQAAQFPVEYPRQLAKTTAALAKLDAAVVGLMEIENDGYGAGSAQQALVNALNTATAPGRYALIDADARTGQVDAMGSDAIKVAFIYQPQRVRPVGRTAALNSLAFVNGGDGSPRNRPALAQAWEQPDGARFITVVNHLKSKGSACDAADAGDGQGNCNAVRVAAATLLRNWLATDPTGTADPDVLILGDLNSYAKEDPVAVFTGAGWRDLVNSYGGAQAYGYAFDGQWGYLDHALATPTLALGQVTDARHWHINADEPSVLDYNVNFKSAGQVTSLYAADEFRTSDHDPAVVSLALNAPVQLRGTAGADNLVGGTADAVFTGGPGRDTLTAGSGRNQFVFNSVLDGGDTIIGFRPGRDSLVLTGLLRGLGAPADPLASGHLLCEAAGNDALVSVDPDGRSGPQRSRPVALLRNLACSALATPDNLRL